MVFENFISFFFELDAFGAFGFIVVNGVGAFEAALGADDFAAAVRDRACLEQENWLCLLLVG